MICNIKEVVIALEALISYRVLQHQRIRNLSSEQERGALDGCVGLY